MKVNINKHVYTTMLIIAKIHKGADMAKNFRLRDDAHDLIRQKTLSIINESQVVIQESDVLHALITEYAKHLTAEQVLKYRETILGRID